MGSAACAGKPEILQRTSTRESRLSRSRTTAKNLGARIMSTSIVITKGTSSGIARSPVFSANGLVHGSAEFPIVSSVASSASQRIDNLSLVSGRLPWLTRSVFTGHPAVCHRRLRSASAIPIHFYRPRNGSKLLHCSRCSLRAIFSDARSPRRYAKQNCWGLPSRVLLVATIIWGQAQETVSSRKGMSSSLAPHEH
jgi:hypothetical protein